MVIEPRPRATSSAQDPLPAPCNGPISQRLALLEFAKGIAILLVFGHHLARTIAKVRGQPYPTLLQWSFTPPGGAYPDLHSAIEAIRPLRALELALASFGYLGVHIFVVASGFGLAYGARSAELRWGAFLVRRLRKLLPAFWIVVAGHALLNAAFHGEWRTSFGTIISRVTLLSSLSSHSFFELNSPLWFMGLIIPLYVVFPLLYRLALSRRAWVWLAALAALGIGVRACLEIPSIKVRHIEFAHAFFICRVPEFYLGVLLGMRTRTQGTLGVSSRSALIIGLSALAGATAAHTWRPAYPILDLSFAALGSAMTLLCYRVASRVSAPLVRCTAWVGVISYALYLTHRPIILHAGRFLRGAFATPDATMEGTMLKLSAVAGVLGLAIVVAWSFQMALEWAGFLARPASYRPATARAGIDLTLTDGG